MLRSRLSVFISTSVLTVLVLASTLFAQAAPPAALVNIIHAVAGKPAPWAIEVEVQTGKGSGSLRIDRPTDDSYRFAVDAIGRQVELTRTPTQTCLISGGQQVAFVGDSSADAALPLSPAGLVSRLISSDSLVSMAGTFLQGDPNATASMLMSIGNFQPEADGTFVSPTHRVSLKVSDDGFEISQKDNVVTIRLVDAEPIATDLPADLRVEKVDRAEMEEMIQRAIWRGTEILAPAPSLAKPAQTTKTVPHGKLFWVGDQRVVMLNGTPEQIGKAHGELLAAEARRCTESTYFLVGLARSLEKGTWSPSDFRDTWKRLEPHIPAGYIAEMDAVATAAGMDPQTFRLAQIFPEFFHCSGFAVWGNATADGKLYHGRVLDYMRMIGLHDSATVFIVKPVEGHTYVNVGYAGFVGSVTGMNAAQVSLGEMGGGGEGNWDGVPMSILMRRALEECGTLDEVKKLWADSPRTCEYYYVWADGKTRTAVGVAATPEKIEFIEPGQAHPKLGEGMADAVTLSAGNRLVTLKQRVSDQYGKITEQSAVDLMCSPVAMDSNLHDVLFVPEDLVLHVAHATKDQPADELPYTRIDAGQLFKEVEEVK